MVFVMAALASRYRFLKNIHVNFILIQVKSHFILFLILSVADVLCYVVVFAYRIYMVYLHFFFPF